VQQALGTRVITSQDWGPDLGIVRGAGRCTPVIWPGVGAQHRSMHLLVLGPASSTVELRHPSEAAYYVVEGEALVEDHDEGTSQPLVTGSMFHVGAGTPYVIAAVGDGVTLLGGPCPPDRALYLPGLADAAPAAPAAPEAPVSPAAP
jgi:mannose-6-phosphate isomerase-like protein (cupin superfamily)